MLAFLLEYSVFIKANTLHLHHENIDFKKKTNFS